VLGCHPHGLYISLVDSGKEQVTASGFRFVDLFAGIGGFHHALSHPAFGGECVLAVELDPDCRRVYRRAFPSTPLVRDVRDITIDGTADRSPEGIDQLVPDHDVLCAGFPCQPFSKSGAQLGVRDQTRGTLFFDILQIVRAKRPRFLLLENVRNLAGPRHRDTWQTIIRSLRTEGYQVSDDPVVFSPHLLPPEYGGRPQVRERVFILASRSGSNASADLWSPPLAARSPIADWDPQQWRIADWLDQDDQIPNIERYQLRPEETGWIEAWDAFCNSIPSDDLPGFPIWADSLKSTPSVDHSTPKWKTDFLEKNSDFYLEHRAIVDEWKSGRFGPLRQRVDEFPASRRKFEWQARSFQPTRATRSLWGLVLHLRPSGIRVKPPTYLPALVAITQTSVIGWLRRRITPREAARLQGLEYAYQDELDDSTAYRQLGNAVNVGAVQWVARSLFAAAGLPWGRERHVELLPRAGLPVQEPIPGLAAVS
jgi:DNA (cytosine-5)-methyltransferase 1